jgi:NADPH:quinone reductase-like Zn-dependent oxidoreductase
MDAEPTASNTVTTMKALRAHQRGGPEQLVYEEAPRPIPGPDEICVAVRAAAITFAELTWPDTWEVGGVDRTPVIPSHEFAGVVVEVGPNVIDLAVGDSVSSVGGRWWRHSRVRQSQSHGGIPVSRTPYRQCVVDRPPRAFAG